MEGEEKRRVGEREGRRGGKGGERKVEMEEKGRVERREGIMTYYYGRGKERREGNRREKKRRKGKRIDLPE